MATIELLLPIPARPGASTSTLDRPATDVAGKVVALVNNGWGSFEDISVALERRLRDDYAAADVIHFKETARDTSASFNAPPAWLDEIARQADVAITGLGNCGGCSAWTCDTSVALERRGLFSAALVTGLFEQLARFNIANTKKAPDHPLVVLEAGFEYTDPASVEAAAAEVLETLFGPARSTTVAAGATH